MTGSAEPVSTALSANGITGPKDSPAGFSPVYGAPSPARWTLYDGLEQQPVCNLPSVVIELADSKSAVEHLYQLRFTLFRSEGQN